MANRKSRRRMGKRLTVREEREFKNLIMIIFIISVVFVLMYLLTTVIVKKGLLSRGYTKGTVITPVVDYETSTIGTVFDKGDKEYYVVFDKFSDNMEKSAYLETLLSMYNEKEKKLPVYKVDMSYGVNKAYESKKSNKSVSKSEDLRINGVTLIKIKDGKNVTYLEDLSKIASELGIEEG